MALLNNPFNFSEWLRCETSTHGNIGTGDDVELGRLNFPDAREGTQIGGSTPNNVALAGMYDPLPNSEVSQVSACTAKAIMTGASGLLELATAKELACTGWR